MPRKIKLNPVFNLAPNWQQRFNFTAKDLVDLFLNTTAHWYKDEDNGMHRKRVAIRRVLMAFLVNGDDISQTMEEIHALQKFQSEWLAEGKGMFKENRSVELAQVQNKSDA